jgi:hypothetical protein
MTMKVLGAGLLIGSALWAGCAPAQPPSATPTTTTTRLYAPTTTRTTGPPDTTTPLVPGDPLKSALLGVEMPDGSTFERGSATPNGQYTGQEFWLVPGVMNWQHCPRTGRPAR